MPYQVVIYPMIIGLSASRALRDPARHHHRAHDLRHADPDAAVPQLSIASLPVELFKAARVDGAGFWRIFFYIMLPMSVPIIVVAIILQVTGIWNDFLFGIVFAGRTNWPMTVQLNNIVNTTTGREGIQRQHGGHHPDGGGAADHLLRLRKTGSCAASPPAR